MLQNSKVGTQSGAAAAEQQQGRHWWTSGVPFPMSGVNKWHPDPASNTGGGDPTTTRGGLSNQNYNGPNLEEDQNEAMRLLEEGRVKYGTSDEPNKETTKAEVHQPPTTSTSTTPAPTTPKKKLGPEGSGRSIQEELEEDAEVSVTVVGPKCWRGTLLIIRFCVFFCGSLTT